MVQCPDTTPFHPTPFAAGAAEPAYTGPQLLHETVGGVPLTYVSNGGQIKCQEISGGDGMMTEADGNQTFMFSFGPLSGLELIKHGQPGTQLNVDFNGTYTDATGHKVNGYYNSPTLPSECDPSSSPSTCPTAGAAGITQNSLVTDPTFDPSKPINLNAAITDPATIMTVGVINGNMPMPMAAFDEDDEFFLTLSNVGMIMRPDLFEQHTVHFHGYPNASSYYDGVPDATWAINIGGSATYYYLAPDAGTYFYHCHITPPEHLQMGMVGQLYVRPRQNRVPIGTSLYASLAGNAPLGSTSGLGQQSDPRTACPGTGPTPVDTPTHSTPDILCSTPLPAPNNVLQVVDPFAGKDQRIPAGSPQKYAYNDGDGSTAYEFDVPLQIHGFDPNFHFVGMTFNPEGFADMKDKYFLLSGRSYPDTVGVPGYLPGLPAAPAPGQCTTDSAHTFTSNPDQCSGAIGTQDTDGRTRFSQPISSLIGLIQGEKALLRISDLDVTEYQTLASSGMPMKLVGFQAKILRDEAGNNMYITSNSITLGGGESLDVIIDSTNVPPGTYFLYTPNLDHLSNGPENFGGLMTEVVVCPTTATVCP
ncbi:MAG TPA: multicopper oxidase domain-containing protein [Candidatus Acidoferrales bacterium]|nr:multicopper oxidase domain-containing protein [Candidatus Acidoferrales bacterium]